MTRRSTGAARHRPRLPTAERGADAFASIVDQLRRIEREGGDGTLTLAGGVSLEVTSLDKPYFPEDGVTKGGVMRYYARLAPAILPAIADRVLVLRRYPTGIHGPYFHQHDPGEHVPAGVRVERVAEAGGDVERRIVGDDPAARPGAALATLLYTVQLGAIVVNAWHSRVSAPRTPDYAVLDLDPQPNTPFPRIVDVARLVHAALVRRGLSSVPKTSGSRGIHMLVPLPPASSFEDAAALGAEVAAEVAESNPTIATVERSIEARPPGSVYVDHLQNALGKTLATVFSVRARRGALVSTPLDWARITRTLAPERYTVATVGRRSAEHIARWERLWREASAGAR